MVKPVEEGEAPLQRKIWALNYNNESMPIHVERYENGSVKLLANAEDGIFEISLDPQCLLTEGRVIIRDQGIARAMQRQGLGRIIDFVQIDGSNLAIVSYLGYLFEPRR